MKVLLLKDVKGVGRAHDVIETADGYALNYLIPKKVAIVATSGAMSAAVVRKARTDERRALNAKLIAQNLATLAETRIVVKAKANEKGHLYDAVGATEIIAAVKAQTNVDLPEEAIHLERPLKEVGESKVPVAAGEAFGEFTLAIEAE